MLFMMKLIEVHSTVCGAARNNLQDNCIHVVNGFWLYEGEEEGLHDGIDYHIIEEQPVESPADMTSSELVNLLATNFSVDRALL